MRARRRPKSSARYATPCAFALAALLLLLANHHHFNHTHNPRIAKPITPSTSVERCVASDTRYVDCAANTTRACQRHAPLCKLTCSASCARTPPAPLWPSHLETDALVAAAHDARQSCLSFARRHCPPLDLDLQSDQERADTYTRCVKYVKQEANLPAGTRVCGARLPRANPCWLESDKSYCLPAFFVLGEMKCGTTSLYSLLLKHPRIVAASTKEPRFFQKRRLKATSASRYAVYFEPAAAADKAAADALTFDASPTHLGSAASAIPWIAAWLPESKLIVAVRHPVQRTYSHWKMGTDWLWAKARDDPSLHQAASRLAPRWLTFKALAERSLMVLYHERCVALLGADERRQPRRIAPLRLGRRIRWPLGVVPPDANFSGEVPDGLSSMLGRCLVAQVSRATDVVLAPNAHAQRAEARERLNDSTFRFHPDNRL